MGDLSTPAVKISGEVDTGKIGVRMRLIRYQAQRQSWQRRATTVGSAGGHGGGYEGTTPLIELSRCRFWRGKPLQIVVSANDNGRTDSQLTYVLFTEGRAARA